MRVLAIADEPYKRLWEQLDKSLLEGVDLILSAGDLPASYLSFLTCFTHAPILYVHGNHDTRYRKTPPEGCIDCEDKILCYNGIRVMGLGGSMRYKPGECMYSEREMERRIRRMWFRLHRTKGVDILLTHAPIRGIGDGDDLCHMGFECFKPFLDKYAPGFMVHGHVHQSYVHDFKHEQSYKDTKVLNASGYVFFDIEPRSGKQLKNNF